MIRPEDILDHLVGYQDGPDWISYGVDKEELAGFLNDAIAAGIVSPPVYTVRDPDTGRLFYDVGQVRLRPGKPQIPAHEHYKGQK